MKNILTIVFLLAAGSVSAQVMADVAPSGQTRDGAVVFYGAESFNKKINYENIKGIPYWKNDYLPAQLYAPLNKKYGVFFIRMNFATNEIEFVGNNDEVKAAYGDQVSRAVVLDPKDSTKILTVFRNDLGEVNVHYINEGKRYYAQELNQGPVKLLKVTHRELKQGDSMMGTLKRYYFVDRAEYFVEQKNKIEKLKKLEKDEILKFIPKTPELEEFLRNNKVSLKKEEDVLRLLEIYNQKS
jgi:hypothetical protein